MNAAAATAARKAITWGPFTSVVVLLISLVAGILKIGAAVQKNSTDLSENARLMGQVVVHLCRFEVAIHQQSFDECRLDFYPQVKVTTGDKP